jgi:hypothetical protein
VDVEHAADARLHVGAGDLRADGAEVIEHGITMWVEVFRPRSRRNWMSSASSALGGSTSVSEP